MSHRLLYVCLSAFLAGCLPASLNFDIGITMKCLFRLSSFRLRLYQITVSQSPNKSDVGSFLKQRHVADDRVHLSPSLVPVLQPRSASPTTGRFRTGAGVSTATRQPLAVTDITPGVGGDTDITLGLGVVTDITIGVGVVMDITIGVGVVMDITLG